MKSNKTVYLTTAAVIAALYAALTLLFAAFGLSFGSIQFRFSEALCILPIFTPAAIPGLTAGCLVANLFSTVNPLDAVFGTLATFLSAVLTRLLAKFTLRGFPVFSLLIPAFVNALIVGVELTLFVASDKAFITAFFLNAASVFAGEFSVLLCFGTALYAAVYKNKRLLSILQAVTPNGTPFWKKRNAEHRR